MNTIDRLFEPRRELGRTGFKATILGIGDLADRSVPLEQCVATIRRAMDAGLNVIDTAPSYEDGYSEQILAAALKGRRDGMFVIDKIDLHDHPVAPQVESSLTRLGMDCVDAFVFHSVSSLEGWDRLTAPGGPIDQLTLCRRQGKCRFRGISSHHPEVLIKAIATGACDIAMFPIGPFVDERYVKEVLPLARRSGVGTVCFKTFGAGKLVADTSGYGRPLTQRPRGKLSSGGEDTGTVQSPLPRLSVEECVHYTLTCDPDVALLGMSFPNEQDAAFAAVDSFTPLSPQQMDHVRYLAAYAVKDKGPCWWNPNP